MYRSVSSAEPAVPTHPDVENLERIAERFDLSDSELAAIAGVSPNTIRFCRATGQPPKHVDTVRAVAAFLNRAKAAQKRTDLALPAHAVRRGKK